MKKFTLLVDSNDNLPIGAIIIDIGDNVNLIKLSNISINKSISEKEFEPKFPENVDMIDQR